MKSEQILKMKISTSDTGKQGTCAVRTMYFTEGVFMSSGNSEINMHIFSIFGRLYHINSETDMHIFSIFGRMYHNNSQKIVYAFAPSLVLF